MEKNLRKSLRTLVLAGFVSVGSLGAVSGLTSCAGPLTPEAQQFGNFLVYTAAGEGIKGELNPASRGTNVNIYAGEQQRNETIAPVNPQLYTFSLGAKENIYWDFVNDFRQKGYGEQYAKEEAQKMIDRMKFE